MESLTEDQLEGLVALGDEFWHAFSDLCNEHLDKAAQSGIPVDYAEMYLGEKTSIYGRRSGKRKRR
jgi:hypothetical protein